MNLFHSFMSLFFLEIIRRPGKTSPLLWLYHLLTGTNTGKNDTFWQKRRKSYLRWNMLWSQYWFLCTAQENLAFLPSFCHRFLTKNTQERHTQKERGSSSSKIIFLCPTSPCWEERAEGRGTVPRHLSSQEHCASSTSPRGFWGPLSPATLARTCKVCITGHISFQPQPQHLQGFGQRQQPQFLLLDPWSREEGEAPNTLKPCLTLCSSLSWLFLKAKSLKAISCFEHTSVCQIANTQGQGLSSCSIYTLSLLSAVLLAGCCRAAGRNGDWCKWSTNGKTRMCGKVKESQRLIAAEQGLQRMPCTSKGTTSS